MPYGVSKQKGRDLDWLKQTCRELVQKNKIVEFLADVALGKDVEQAVGNEGEVIRVPAAVRDRIKATELLLDRGFGKSDQHIDVTRYDSSQRPDVDVLLSTVAVLRKELDSLRSGAELEKVE